MSVYLVETPLFKRTFSTPTRGMPSIALATLAGYLRGAGFTPRLVDAKLEGLGIPETVKRVDAEARVIGITATSMDIGLAGRLAEELRRKCPRALLVVGGAHSSAAPADTLARFGAFDAAAFGEGEETFLAVCQAVQTGRSLAGIAGVAYREASGGITVNPARPLMPDLSRLGKPAWDLLPPGKAYFVAVSRGCPFDCSFCFRLFGKTVRPRPVDDIIEEVEGLIERAHPEEFQISGATFGIPRDHAMALLDRMIERDFGARVRWRAMTRVNVVDREMLRKLKRSGCYSLSFGIESGDDRILADTGKGINVRLSRDAVKMAKEGRPGHVGLLHLRPSGRGSGLHQEDR
jgi:radical SAM superfamily enzyme YgiQ (UPF0313 family)